MSKTELKEIISRTSDVIWTQVWKHKTWVLLAILSFMSLQVLWYFINNSDHFHGKAPSPLAKSPPFKHLKHVIILNKRSDEIIGHSADASGIYDRSQTCKFPILDPFDPSILPYVHHPPPLACPKIQPDLVFKKADGHMVINWTQLGHSKNLVALESRPIYRQRGNDHKIILGNWTLILPDVDRVKLDTDVEVIAIHQETQKRIFHDVIPFVHCGPRKAANVSDPIPEPKTAYNVMIVGIDSTSRSNMIRNMPKTYGYLTETLKAIDLRGYSKVSDNTFPNTLALLTGRKAFNKELKQHYQKAFIDEYPFIWKNYSDAGYFTALVEEQPGIFSYKAKGFKNPPTDLYFRPFGLRFEQMLKISTGKKSVDGCAKNRPEILYYLEILKEIAFNDLCEPFFAFSFFHKLSHDKASQIQQLDGIFQNFLTELSNHGILNNTVLIFLSDHGNRFDDIRSTLVGRIEERMPFLAMSLPPTFKLGYSQAYENLVRNTGRLTAPFDIYETLVDILNRDFSGSKRSSFKNRGVSLFSEIPKSRTCKEVDIDNHFCVCQEEFALDIASDDVIQAANHVVRFINSDLIGQYAGKCSKLTLRKILNAQSQKSNQDVIMNAKWQYQKFVQSKNVTNIISFIHVTLQVKPGGGIFEALLQHNPARAEKFTTSSDRISRINSYGARGNCVSMIDRNLEKFCFCKAT